MRSARMDMKNENGEIPADCMLLHKNPKCKMIVKVYRDVLAISIDWAKFLFAWHFIR